MALKASSGVWSTERQCETVILHGLLSFLSLLTREPPRSAEGKLRTGARELLLRQCASPRQRPGRGVGENILFPLLQPIEDALCRGLGRGLRYLEASGHIGVDGAQENGMDRHAFARQERPQ
jgi:hypothetical protein